MFDKELYSKHIFIFPFKIDFLIDKNGVNRENFDKKTNLEEINKIIESNRNWRLEKFSDLTNETDIRKKNLSYNTKLYFYDNIRNTIFTGYSKIDKSDKIDFSSEIVLNYNYLNVMDLKYIIKEYNNDKKYILDIKKIRLKIYETGVGSLSFFLDNYTKNNEDDILKINSLGRQVYTPFKNTNYDNNNENLAKKKNEIPDYIEIVGKDSKIIAKEDFESENNFNDNIRLSNIITKILGFERKDNGNKNIIGISPIIDSRMYTVMINNQKNYFSRYTSKKGNIVSYKNDEYWYKNIFVDNEDCMCQDEEMLERLLVSSTYSRFLKWGSLYGASRYSFVLLKENNSVYYLNDYMETMYYEMITLVLAQRASILNFSDEISKISRLKRDNIKGINTLYKNYLQFVNRFYIIQPTAQEQGIELYKMLLEKSDIVKLINNLDNEIKSLHEYAKLADAEKSSESLKIIEKLNLYFLIPTFITGLLGINIFQKYFSDIYSIKFFSTNLFEKFNFWLVLLIFTLILVGLNAAIIHSILFVIKRKTDNFNE